MTTTVAAPPAPRVLDPHTACLHLERMYRAALRMTRSTHDAEDLAQEVFVKVLARPRTIHGGDELSYLMRALRNTHHSAHRAAGRRSCASVAPETLESLPRHGGDPHDAVETRELLGAIAALPERQREVVLTVDLLGLSYGEAATALGVPVGTVMSRLHRARAAVALAVTVTVAAPVPA